MLVLRWLFGVTVMIALGAVGFVYFAHTDTPLYLSIAAGLVAGIMCGFIGLMQPRPMETIQDWRAQWKLFLPVAIGVLLLSVYYRSQTNGSNGMIFLYATMIGMAITQYLRVKFVKRTATQ